MRIAIFANGILFNRVGGAQKHMREVIERLATEQTLSEIRSFMKSNNIENIEIHPDLTEQEKYNFIFLFFPSEVFDPGIKGL